MTHSAHDHALKLRRMLIDLHTCYDAGRAVGIWDIREAEQDLYAHLRAHRTELGRTAFWAGHYAELDEHDQENNR